MHRNSLLKLLPGLAIALGLPLASWAGFFGVHPRYEHAATDLRTARSFIARPDAPNVEAQDSAAIGQIDAALGEIRKAALDDWKDVWNPPPIDTSLNRRGRLREALKLLQRARGDVGQEEDDAQARGLQNRAIGHINQAIGFVQTAVAEKETNGQM
jgi:hypothetical protein